jgi:hypothetical protein
VGGDRGQKGAGPAFKQNKIRRKQNEGRNEEKRER